MDVRELNRPSHSTVPPRARLKAPNEYKNRNMFEVKSKPRDLKIRNQNGADKDGQLKKQILNRMDSELALRAEVKRLKECLENESG